MPAEVPDSAAERFYQSQRTARLGDASITQKKMFGTTALCVGGKVFMFPWRGTLVVKIPAARIEELIAAGHAERFDPGHGRTSATWAAVFADAGEQWPHLAEQARSFVAG